MALLGVGLGLLALAPPADAQARKRQAPASAAPAAGPYVTARPAAALQNKQVVLETTLGTIVMQLDAAAAPNHVGFMLDQTEAGAYDGTVFHRAVAMGIVQGGDPISKDPGEVGAVRHRWPQSAEARAQRPHARPRGRRGGAPARQARQRWRAVLHLPHRPARPRRTVHGPGRGRRGPRGRRADLADAARRGRAAHHPRRHHEGDRARHAAGQCRTLRRDLGRGARDLARHDRHHARRHRHRVRSRHRARACAQFPAVGAARRVRRHRVPSRGAEVRRPGRRSVVASSAADASAAQGRWSRDSASSIR